MARPYATPRRPSRAGDADLGERPALRYVRRPAVLLGVFMLVVAAAVLATHWPALSARALSFDDQQYLTENYLVQHPSWRSASRFLREVTAPSTVGGYYQPLAMISLMFDYAAAGRPDNLRPFHQTSLALHVMNTMLIIVLLYMLFGSPWAAAMAGLLSGVHPLTVEPIPWVGERKTLLAAFFALWCLVFYVRYVKRTSWTAYGACIVTFILALMSKPTSTPLPVVMLLMDFWPLRRLSRRSLLEKIPLFAIAAVSAVITFISQKTTSGAAMPTEYPASRVPLILCHNIIFYLYKMVRPVNLSSHYPFPDPVALSDRMVLIGFIGTCILIPALLISLRWTRAVLAGWAIFFVAIFPTMQIIGFSNVIASDKFAYLPSVGLLMILAWCLACVTVGAWPHRGWLRVRYAGVLLVVMVVALVEARATRRYLTVFRDTKSLFTHMLELAPRAPSLQYGLAEVLFEEGDYEAAIRHGHEAVRLKDDDPVAKNNLGLALARKGHPDEAMRYYREALELRPDYAAARTNLGNILFERGSIDAAMECYATALDYRPDYPEAHLSMGVAWLKKGQVDRAIDCYRKALDLRPSYAAAHTNLGNAFAEQGRIAEALDQYTEAIQLDPKSPKAHNNIGNLLAGQGRLDEAAAHYETSLRLSPDAPHVLNNLGAIRVRQARLDEATGCYTRALALDPSFLLARISLGNVLHKQGKVEQAIAVYQEGLRTHPGNAALRFSLGLALEDQGNLEQAMHQYREVLQIDAQHAAARQRLNAVVATRPAGTAQ